MLKRPFYIVILLLLAATAAKAQSPTRYLIAAEPFDVQSTATENKPAPLPIKGVKSVQLPQENDFNTEGKDFWLTFLQNAFYQAHYGVLNMQLVFSSRYAANITVSNPNTGYEKRTSVRANDVTIISVPATECYNYGSDIVQNTGLHITSTAPISVYGANFANYTFDVTNVIPTPSLGTDYIIQTYQTKIEGNTGFAVLATEDNTQVTAVLACPTRNREKGTYTFTLHKGQVWQVTTEIEKGGLSGSVIKADKPVAVFNGDQTLFIPDYKPYSDHVVEQAAPVQTWGTKFVLTKSNGQNADYVIFTALRDGTEIRKDGETLATINTCESYIYRLTADAAYIETSAPAACYLYMSSRTSNSSRVGDPSMVWITPQEQGIRQITFSTFSTKEIKYHYMNIVVPASAAGAMTFDGKPLTGFLPVPGKEEYAYLSMEINHATHTLGNTQAEFTAHVYGMGVDESYAYCVGGYLKRINDTDIDDIIEQVTQEQTFDICEGQSVTISGKQYAKDTTFTETADDRIRKYTVKVHPSFAHTDTVEFRKGTSFDWHGQTVSKPGTYRDTHYTVYGCDSIYRLIAKYDNITEYYDTVCSSAFYKFRGESFALPQDGGFPKDLTLNRTEGDWEHRMHLRIMPQVEYINDSYVLEPEETLDYHGIRISRAGDYTVNLQSRYGCDSIVTLHVTQPVNSRAYYTICEGDSYDFAGMTLTESGAYNREITASDGSVHVHQLVLTVEQPHNTVIRATVCEGEVYEENGFHESVAGTYHRNLRSRNGCDSTVTLILDICQPDSRTIEDVICAGAAYEKYGFSEQRAGTYVRALRNRFGCDSTVTLVLREVPSYRFEENIRLLEGETRLWHGQTLDQSGDYTAAYTTADGCDSVYTAHVRQFSGLEEEVYDTVCFAATYTYRGHTFDIPAYDPYPRNFVMEARNKKECKRYRMILTLLGSTTTQATYVLAPHETVTFGTQTITREGVYTETFRSRFGCDSTVVLTVTQPVIDFVTETAGICAGETYTFGGKEISRPGTYLDSVRPAGREGWVITQLTLNVNPAYSFVTDKIIQSGGTYEDDNFTESVSGTYHRDFRTVHGCDSTYTLHLTVCEEKSAELTATILEGGVYDSNGFLAYTGGDYTRTDLTADGCDSTTTLHLTVLPPLEPEYEDGTFCSGASYTWQGTEYTAGGTYTMPYTLPNGREGVRVLRLREVPVYKDTVFATICQGGTYDLNGFHESEAATYTHTAQSVGGCDSTITLVLKVNKTYSRDIHAAICEGDTYSGYGVTTGTGGDYIRRYETVDGCDSVLNIHVTVNHPTTYIKRDTINFGQSYPWLGKTYTATVYQRDTLVNAVGCDSIVILDLRVNDLLDSTLYVTFCEGDSMEIFGDTLVKDDGIYQRMCRASTGADSLVAYVVTLIPRTYENTVATIRPGETFPWHGNRYGTPVSLRDTLVNAEGCDSICTLELTVVGSLTYTVRFENYDGSELRTYELEQGAIPSYEGTPEREKDGDEYNWYEFTFTGWADSQNNFYGKDNALPAVTQDTVYTAQYKKDLYIILQEQKDDDFYTNFSNKYNGERATKAWLNRQFTRSKWATLCLPFNVPSALLTNLNMKGRVYEFCYTKGDTEAGFTLYFAQAKMIEAGKGYIVNANAILAQRAQFEFPGVTVNTDVDIQSRFDIANLEGYNSEGSVYLIGTLRKGRVYGSNTGSYYMGLKDNRIYYPNAEQGTVVNAYRGIFFNKGEEMQATRVRIVAEGEDGEIVGELEVVNGGLEDAATPRKYVQDGILYIIRDGARYTVQGQRID